MLCGASVSGIAVAVTYILTEFQYILNGFRLSRFIFTQSDYLGSIGIKLKLIWLSEPLGSKLAGLWLFKP